LSTRGSSGDSAFDRLYAQHCRKKNPADAFKAWKQTAKVRPPDDELMRAHAKANEEWKKREPQYRPYLGSWLRAHGWEDEPDPDDGDYFDAVTADWYRVNAR
jgi:hypothetical protein